MIEILFTSFNKKITNNQWDRLFSQLPGPFQRRISRYKRWQDKQAGLFGKLLLLEILIKYGYPSDCLNSIKLSEFGRPYIEDKIDFNISHSGDYVLCAVTDSGRLGIDIEKIMPIDLAEYRLFLSLGKIETAVHSSNKLDEFYTAWTTSESVLKADGRGLSIPFSEVNTVGSKVILDNNLWFINNVFIDLNYSCHLATNIKNPKIELRKIEFN